MNAALAHGMDLFLFIVSPFSLRHKSSYHESILHERFLLQGLQKG
jgi:hypothetical protein